MKKSGVALAAVGILIGVGIILSFYGNFVLFEDLIQGNGDVGIEQNLSIEAVLDDTETQTGIYAVQILDFNDETITVSIIDPLDIVIESQSINQEAYEGLFDITESGTFKLLIESNGEQVNVFGVIGPEPNEGKRALSNISLYILIAGLIGMAGVALYIVINRRKEN